MAYLYDAVSYFNDGNISTLKIYEEIGLDHGYYTTIACNVGNKTRIDNSRRKSSQAYKKQRKYLRGKRKRKGDENKEIKGTTYKGGEFS